MRDTQLEDLSGGVLEHPIVEAARIHRMDERNTLELSPNRLEVHALSPRTVACMRSKLHDVCQGEVAAFSLGRRGRACRSVTLSQHSHARLAGFYASSAEDAGHRVRVRGVPEARDTRAGVADRGVDERRQESIVRDVV